MAGGVWYMKSGKCWMIQWCWDGWISFGMHVDLKKRFASDTNIQYAPYMDIHFLWFIFSVGVNPKYSNPYAANIIGRGGEMTYGNNN